MPRALMLSYYFPPMGGVEIQRVTSFVRHLPEFGWEPIVVTAKSGGHTGKEELLFPALPEDLMIERIATVDHPSVTLRRRLLQRNADGWEQFRKSRRFLGRLIMRLDAFDRTRLCFPDPINWWAFCTGLHINHLCRKYKPDVLWATGYPWSALCLLAKASEQTGIPSVGDIRDPWSWHPQGFWEGERHRDRECTTLKGLTHVVTVTEGVTRKYTCLYPELGNKISTIRNGFEDADRLPAKTFSIPSLFCYTGSLTAGNLKDLRKQTLDTFLNALSLCLSRGVRDTERIRVRIAGMGVKSTQHLIDEYRLWNSVTIDGNLPHDQARDLRARADALLMVMGNGEEAAAFVPLKVYEYLAANRPILALLPEHSEAGKIILKKKRGVVCRIDNIEDIAGGIERILKGEFEYDPDSDVSEYSYQHATEKLAELFDSLAFKQSNARTR